MSPQRQTYFKQFESRRCSIPIDEGRGPGQRRKREKPREGKEIIKEIGVLKKRRTQRPRDAELNACEMPPRQSACCFRMLLHVLQDEDSNSPRVWLQIL